MVKIEPIGLKTKVTINSVTVYFVPKSNFEIKRRANLNYDLSFYGISIYFNVEFSDFVDQNETPFSSVTRLETLYLRKKGNNNGDNYPNENATNYADGKISQTITDEVLEPSRELTDDEKATVTSTLFNGIDVIYYQGDEPISENFNENEEINE